MQQKPLQIYLLFLVFTHPLERKYKVGRRRLGKAVVVIGVRCSSNKSGNEKNQGKARDGKFKVFLLWLLS